MGDFVPKPGSGALFRNRDRVKDTHPEYRGNVVDPDGKAWEVAAWVKEGKGGKFFSLALKEPYRAGRAAGDAHSPSGGHAPDDMEGEIPF